MSFWTGDRWVPLHPRQRATPRRRRVHDVLATAVMVLILFAIAVPFDGASGSTPQLTMAPDEGPPSASVLIRGTGFTLRTRLEFTWDATPIGWPAVRVGKDGTFSAVVVIPAAAAGTHTVGVITPSNAARRQATVVASTMFQVREAPLARAAVSASPSTAPSGVVAPSNSPSPSPTSAGATSSPQPSATPILTPVPTPVATPVPTVPPPTPTPPPASAKLLFGIGPEADQVIGLPIVRDAPVTMLTSWYNNHGDLSWMQSWKNDAIPQWLSRGHSLHLIVYDAGSESQHGDFCGKDYLFSPQFDADMQALAQIWAQAGSQLYVTLFTEFQTYSCPHANQFVGFEPFYAALKAKYRSTMATFHRIVPGSHVSLGWGGWQARWDDPVKSAGRSLFQHFADVMSESDFQSFQAMQNDGNADDIRAMTTILGAYGPVMVAHYKPDNGNQSVWESDLRSIFTDAYVADLVARGLFAFSFMDDRNISASGTAYELARAGVTRYGR